MRAFFLPPSWILNTKTLISSSYSHKSIYSDVSGKDCLTKRSSPPATASFCLYLILSSQIPKTPFHSGLRLLVMHGLLYFAFSFFCPGNAKEGGKVIVLLPFPKPVHAHCSHWSRSKVKLLFDRLRFLPLEVHFLLDNISNVILAF